MCSATRIENAPNLNHLWATLLVEELVRAGVCCFCLSPGSRSTPLALAVANHPAIPRQTHFDERGAAFHALGWARAAGRPACLVCTSGSAVANYWPAVVEAARSHTPLVMLTADRPPELLDSGANQAIDQARIFDGYVRWQMTLPCPTLEIPPQYVLTTADQAVYRSGGAHPGPVHLNCPFREPLAPAPAANGLQGYLAPISAWLNSDTPHTRWEAPHTSPAARTQAAFLDAIAGAERGLLLLGELLRPEMRIAASALAHRLGWPVFADIGSGLRQTEDGAPYLVHYDQLLLSPAFRELCRPDFVLHVGGPFVSKRLAQYLAALRPPCAHVARHPERQDPAHQMNWRLHLDEAAFCEWLAPHAPWARDTAWVEAMESANRAAAGCIEGDSVLTSLNEISAARALSRMTPGGSVLFLGNSMPIRDMDMFAAPRPDPPWAAVSRGASGIDGNIATAAGYARATAGPVTVLLGDLALLHDLNSLALLRGLETPFVVVVFNNDGGGIFHFLPVAEYPEHFDRYFGAPHGMGFEHAAELFGLGYARPGTPADFAAAYEAALAAGAPVLIEVRSDRAANVALHRELQARIAAAVEQALRA